MSLVNKITAYGTPGIVAAGAVAIWGQSLLQWVTQPSHMLPVAAITAVGAITAAKRKGKQEAPQALPSQEAPQALPQSTTAPSVAEQAQAYVQGLRDAQREAQRPMVVDQSGHVVKRHQV